MRLTPQDIVAAEKEMCSRSLSYFLKRGWPVIDPGQTYLHGWHMDAMAEHLEAAVDGKISRLLINIPPGTSKSSMVGVFFPAWLWGPKGMPHSRILSASHEQDLAIRDNRKSRLLIESDWYQSRWPVQMTSDQNEKRYFENDKRGFRQASAVKGMTGKRGDFVIWDDPLSPEKAYSDVERETANRVFSETLPLRLNNPDSSVIIIVMQRLHEGDVSGYILENDFGYEHLMLPMEYEPDRARTTSIGFKDPRTKEGELLMPDRFSRKTVERDKKVLGPFAHAGQYQQRPAPREGGLFKPHKMEVIQAPPVCVREVRGWDLAATADVSAARTAGVRIGRLPDGRTVIVDVVKGQLGPADVTALIKNTAAIDGRGVEGSLPQDPGQAGKAQVQSLLASLAGLVYRATPETGDKVTRATPLAAQIDAGNVLLVKGDWNRDFINELASFPSGKFADQVDAASRAFMALTLAPPRAKQGRQR
jgi:predicted phage terminase large subunit-like protein